MTTDATERTANDVAADAYQVIGSLAAAGGLFDHPEVVRALDYFSRGWTDPTQEILPFGEGLPDPDLTNGNG